MRRQTVALGATILTGAFALVGPAAASADCTSDLNGPGINLVDSNQANWDIENSGDISDGQLFKGTPDERSDAYDSFPYMAIDDGTNGRENYFNPDNSCTYEADGRQVAFPAMTTTSGLELSRKVYVPADGPGFARFVNTIHNPTGAAQTVKVYTSDGNEGDLGSDSNTVLTGTSTGTGSFVDDGAGNYRLDTPVTWFTTSDGNTDLANSDPRLAHVLDAPSGSTVPDRVDEVRQESQDPDQLSFEYRDVTVPAGATYSYLEFEAMRVDDPGARDAAAYISGTPDAIYAGLADSELAQLRNWSIDNDGDGVRNRVDNCPNAANADQADQDGDGQGDACDSDIDGDGIPNDTETAFGTNPRSADTDGDGVRDNADDCPKIAGSSADGCPTQTVVAANNIRRASATTVSVKRSGKSGALTITTKGTAKGTGAAGSRDCTNGLVAVQVKVRKLTVSNRRVKLTSACTFTSKVTFHRSSRQLRSPSVRASFLGSDGLLPSHSKRVAVN